MNIFSEINILFGTLKKACIYITALKGGVFDIYQVNSFTYSLNSMLHPLFNYSEFFFEEIYLKSGHSTSTSTSLVTTFNTIGFVCEIGHKAFVPDKHACPHVYMLLKTLEKW